MENVDIEKPKNYRIYLITNVVNGKQYAGKTSLSAEHRFGQHKYEARTKINRYLCKAIRKYGEESFRVETLCDGLTRGQANEEEKRVIRERKLTDSVFGYNLTAGGDGVIPNEATVEKMKANSGMKRWDVPDEELVRLYEEGVSTSQLAEKYSCSLATIRRHLKNSSARMRTKSDSGKIVLKNLTEHWNLKHPENTSEILRLYQEGWTLQRLGDKFGLSLTSIYRRLCKAGIERRPHGKPKGWPR